MIRLLFSVFVLSACYHAPHVRETCNTARDEARIGDAVRSMNKVSPTVVTRLDKKHNVMIVSAMRRNRVIDRRDVLLSCKQR